jgi:glycosyltransferase involved in cell wall biosynthesis
MDTEAKLKNLKFTVLMGGAIDQNRRDEAIKGEKPRIDELEMESRYGARILDFFWLAEKAEKNPVSRILLKLARQTRQMSMFLALNAFTAVKNDDVIYATGEDVGLPLGALLRIFKRKKPKLIMRLEEPIYGRTPFRRKIYQRYFGFGSKGAALILCRTTAHMNLLENLFGINPEKKQLFHETIDNKFFSQENPVVEKNIALEPSSPYIFSAGLEMRDYDTLLDAIKDIPLQVIIAAGSPWSKFRFDEAKREIPDNVIVQRFSPGEMRELYRKANLIVVPVRPTMRSCGITVVLEAWAMERPLIASGTEGLVDYIQNGETGLMVSPGDTAALRSAITDLLDNPDKAKKLAKNGHQHVMDKLNMDNYIAGIGEIVLNLISLP